ALLAIDGFDPQFRAAGDDVDVCWRLQEQGATLGFHAAAVVWHRRRSSIRGYWQQQRGYGHAEALLERKWPERYNRRGHLTWAGRLYDRASARSFRPRRIYHGTWGTGPFQPEETLGNSSLAEIVQAPEWYLVLAMLAGVSLLGFLWGVLFWTIPLLTAGAGALLVEAVHGGLRADFGRHGRTGVRRLKLGAVTAFLHLLQPAARLSGRLSHGLSPWRQRRPAGIAFPRRTRLAQWYESWSPPRERVVAIESAARGAGARIQSGGPYSRWDLELSGGPAGSARLLVSVEEHGRGRQLVLCRIWPHVAPAAWRAGALLGLFAAGAGATQHPLTTAVLSGLVVVLAALATRECGIGVAAARAAVLESAEPQRSPHPARPTAFVAAEGTTR
ncbi:MAG: glycosyl transferase, partial [Actinobacteria bacterium]|nr:glycosyl transferase [Actinomycetota bacterium]